MPLRAGSAASSGDSLRGAGRAARSRGQACHLACDQAASGVSDEAGFSLIEIRAAGWQADPVVGQSARSRTAARAAWLAGASDNPAGGVSVRVGRVGNTELALGPQRIGDDALRLVWIGEGVAVSAACMLGQHRLSELVVGISCKARAVLVRNAGEQVAVIWVLVVVAPRRLKDVTGVVECDRCQALGLCNLAAVAGLLQLVAVVHGPCCARDRGYGIAGPGNREAAATAVGDCRQFVVGPVGV